MTCLNTDPKTMNFIKTLVLETRPQYLLLSVLLVCLGGSLAHWQGIFHWQAFWLCLLGLVLLHISTNVLNDYFDHSSGIDLETVSTPFNGGSGILKARLLQPRQVLTFGLAAFALAIPIGAYLVVTVSWQLLPLFLLGSLFVIFNTSFITRLGFGMGELAAGLGLGALPVFGSAWIIHGEPAGIFLVAAVPSAFWVFNLLLLNEFPDEWADRLGGRKTLVIQLGQNKALLLYAVLSAAAFLWITFWVWAGYLPRPCLLAGLTLPLAVRAVLRARGFDFGGAFLKAQADNVGVALASQGLMTLGYIWASV